MSKSHKFNCGDGTTVQLNSLQLGALLSCPTTPPQFTSWPTYWALRNRRLIEGAQHTTRTVLSERGKAVIADYERKRNGSET